MKSRVKIVFIFAHSAEPDFFIWVITAKEPVKISSKQSVNISSKQRVIFFCNLYKSVVSLNFRDSQFYAFYFYSLNVKVFNYSNNFVL